MYISNFKSIKEKIKCNSEECKFLIKNGACLLSSSGVEYFFSDTKANRILISKFRDT